MADDKVSLWGNTLKFGKSPASGEMLVGNGTGFTLTASNVIWGNPVEFTVPIRLTVRSGVRPQALSSQMGLPNHQLQQAIRHHLSPITQSNQTCLVGLRLLQQTR